MNPHDHGDFRRRADVVRQVPLETVLLWRGAARDPHDRCKWHTEQGPLSIRGPKFSNWWTEQGGGGAIDLVMHLAGVDFRAAVTWLEQQLAVGPVTAGGATPLSAGQARASLAANGPGALRLPVPDEWQLGRVRHYLTQRRRLDAGLLDALWMAGKFYADQRGNAVFLLVAGREQRPVGAELRGTGSRVWRGLAPGTRKDEGFFWIGTTAAHDIVLCESAIDAISCFQLDPRRICISTAGVRTNPRWLPALLARGYRVHCGFDTDDAGEEAATRIITWCPPVHRLGPPAHDWNDALTSGQ
jgi:hypothetical protein